MFSPLISIKCNQSHFLMNVVAVVNNARLNPAKYRTSVSVSTNEISDRK